MCYTEFSNIVHNFFIGKWQNDSTYPFTGYIDDAVFINNAVGLAKIKEHYAQGLEKHQNLAQK